MVILFHFYLPAGVFLLSPAGYLVIASGVPQNNSVDNQLFEIFVFPTTVRFRAIGCPVLN
jgi:hypothetical protein